MQAFIGTFNADASVEEVVHVSDIHLGSEPCTAASTRPFQPLEGVSVKPLIYTPGDNEWSDCTKAKEEPGSDFDNSHPTDDLAARQLGAASARSSSRTRARRSASTRCRSSRKRTRSTPHSPRTRQYVENVMWEQSKTVFVTLNVPGGSNNDIDPWYAKTHPTPWNPDQQTEMDRVPAPTSAG